MAQPSGEVITSVYAIVGENQARRIMERVDVMDEIAQWQQRLAELQAKPVDALTDTDWGEINGLAGLSQAWVDNQRRMDNAG